VTPAPGAPQPPAGLEPGTRLGRYEIQGRLGAGGGGCVYRAVDTTLRRTVALKILNEGADAGDRLRRRFLREAEAASALNHPHIVTVYEIGADRGIDYIAMEYIDGKSLREHIRKRRVDFEPLYRWAIQTADALTAAHDAGIVHRDLKPGNIMINERGDAKLVDFGLAKAPEAPSGGSEEAETLTVEGAVMGTFAYIAPEQAEGRPVDSRADLFSFGCVLYEMASGRRAFTGGSDLSVLGAVIHKDPQPLRELTPEIPASLDRIIAGCLRKEPDRRWRHAADVRALLEQSREEWAAGQAAARAAGRGSWWRWPAAAAAGALLALGAIWYRGGMTPAPAVTVIEPLTTDGGLSESPSLSRDGSLLAFASDRAGDGNMDIWLQQVGGASLIRLTRDEADETDPDLSPDGTRVAFRSEKDGGGVYVMPALGGEPALIAAGGRGPRFSPDGRSIAYWTGRDGAALVPGSARAFVVPAGGGQPREIGGGLLAALYPAWSPAGDAVLVVGRKTPAERGPDWWIAPLGSGDARALGILAKLDAEYGPAASQQHVTPLRWLEGGRVLFAARFGDPVNLWILEIDAKSARTRGDPVRLTSGTSNEIGAAVGLTKAGERIAFSSQSLNFDLWAVPVDMERGRKTAPLRRLTESSSGEFYPSIARDGSKLAFAAWRPAGNSVCLLEPASRRETTLLALRGALRPRLSGNGAWVAFSNLQGDVMRVSARGGTVAELCKGCGTPTDVSFDGSLVLLEPHDTPEDVRVLDAATGKVSTLAPASGALYDGALSPDGGWVAFHETRKGSPHSQLFAARIEAGKAVDRAQWIAVTQGDATHRAPAWSPGGNALYFLSDRDGFRCLWARLLHPATRRPEGGLIAVEHFHHVRRSMQKHRGFDSRIGLAVAGGAVVLSLADLSGNIWMMDRPAR
jgi:Tol biopolymer transport system component/predicted Ser/Thr protein kinase